MKIGVLNVQRCKEQTISGKDDYGRDMSLRRSVSNNKENLSEKDEFGRDIELRKAFASSISQDINNVEDFIDMISAKLKVMSWADFQDEEDDEEEQRTTSIQTCIANLKEQRLQRCYKQLGDARASLLSIGLYELEDGEVIH